MNLHKLSIVLGKEMRIEFGELINRLAIYFKNYEDEKMENLPDSDESLEHDDEFFVDNNLPITFRNNSNRCNSVIINKKEKYTLLKRAGTQAKMNLSSERSHNMSLKTINKERSSNQLSVNDIRKSSMSSDFFKEDLPSKKNLIPALNFGNNTITNPNNNKQKIPKLN